MNISAMKADWLLEGKMSTKVNLNTSLRRGTYTQKNINGFLSDIKEKGMSVAEAARRNAIPRGSRDHVYKVATQ